MIRWSKTFRLVKDHLGSIVMAINVADGTIEQELTYDEFGNILADTKHDFQPFGFAGGRYDGRTGFTKFGVRNYDSGTGQWTSKDPILFAGGDTKLYGYVGSDPVNYIDPEGKRPIREWPRYGNWCGKNWCGGKRPSKNDGKIGKRPPVDDLDKACKDHDLCYDGDKSKSQCDKEFVNELEGIEDGGLYKDVFRFGAKKYFRE